MYKVVRIERFNDSVFRDDFKFTERSEAEAFFSKEELKDYVVDISLLYCIPFGGETELVRHSKGKPVIRTESVTV